MDRVVGVTKSTEMVEKFPPIANPKCQFPSLPSVHASHRKISTSPFAVVPSCVQSVHLISLTGLGLLTKGIGISPGDLLGLSGLELCILCLLLLLLTVLGRWWWCGFPCGGCKDADEFHRDSVSDVCCQRVIQVDVAQFEGLQNREVI